MTSPRCLPRPPPAASGPAAGGWAPIASVSLTFPPASSFPTSSTRHPLRWLTGSVRLSLFCQRDVSGAAGGGVFWLRRRTWASCSTLDECIYSLLTLGPELPSQGQEEEGPPGGVTPPVPGLGLGQG